MKISNEDDSPPNDHEDDTPINQIPLQYFQGSRPDMSNDNGNLSKAEKRNLS